MSGPDIDLEKSNFLGGLDRLATHFAIAVIAVVPTFLTCVSRPARLRPLLDREAPDGRDGVLLSPGAFFFLSLLLSFIIAAMLATPETLSYNGSYIGPDLAVAVQSAAIEGNIWKLIGTIMPIYGMAVIFGVLGAVLTPFANRTGLQHGWSLRISVRAAFYVMGALVSWIMLTTAIIDLIRLRAEGGVDVSRLYMMVTIPAIGVIIWMYAGLFRAGGANSWRRSILLAMSMMGLIVAFMMALSFILAL